MILSKKRKQDIVFFSLLCYNLLHGAAKWQYPGAWNYQIESKSRKEYLGL